METDIDAIETIGEKKKVSRLKILLRDFSISSSLKLWKIVCLNIQQHGVCLAQTSHFISA